jgi:ATP-dependent helicase/nuclease subunit B
LCDLPPVSRCIESPHGEVRFQAALDWLTQQQRNRPLLVVAHSLDAARDLLRAATLQLKATFGWALDSLSSLSVRLSALPLAERRLSVATPLALEAVCVRVVSELGSLGQLGRFEHVADRPGLPRALLRTFSDLALADVDPTRLEKECPELATAFERYRQTLAESGLADRAEVLREAVAAVRARKALIEFESVCLYDLAPKTKLERDLVAALASVTERSLMTLASGEAASIPEGCAIVEPSEVLVQGSALQRLQAQLFTSGEFAGSRDDTVSILSAPGESRECVEIARRILEEAERGVPFDRMAILLRSPFHYRTHLIEALRRASIPAHFTRGAVRPEPGGRALLVLLRCAAEGLSAVRFAEYLSLGVTPSAPFESKSSNVRPADDAVASLLDPRGAEAAVREREELTAPEKLQFPRRWEALLVDAAVVGGAERWRRRLAGLEQELVQKASHPDEAPSAQRDLVALRALAAFALPLVERLGRLPGRALWGEWIQALRELAEHTIARPEVILGVLSELEIVRDAGPVSLAEVRTVLEERLGEIQAPPLASRGGEVLVASVEEARGRVFDTVFVPGLAEKLFPQRVVEDPLLSDRQRAIIDESLEVQAGRIHAERQALRVAVGCARRRVLLSYPRFESDKARPRVPSFYALEAIRAAEGTLPGFAALARRADAESRTRMGWPAPEQADAAIDASEYDLATLRTFLTGEKSLVEGAARYLVTDHRTLGRALQARARRWRPEWRNVDGLVDPSPEARAALDRRYRTLQGRGFSVTALERYAGCPYRFFLATVVGLRPRATIGHVEELEPATRGLLFHEVVHRAAAELVQRDLLSDEADAEAAKKVVDRVIAAVSDRVWQDAVEDLRVDVHYWLRELSRGEWQPVDFELPFGLEPDGAPEQDPAEPVRLDSGLSLRGRIDAVEQRHGELRATDYKTGEAPSLDSSIIAGGTRLQPALYALVLEKLFPNSRVTGGNAYYCTTRGEFTRRHVELNELTREAAVEIHAAITRAFADGFFPAAPAPEACNFCDFRVNCGPYERERVEHKNPARLESLVKLRSVR